MKVPFLDLARRTAENADELSAAADRVIRSGWFVLGPEVDAFERAFGHLSGGTAVGCASGLDALTLSLRALGVGAGDEVIVPSNTYIASWLAVSAVGAVPVAVDPDPETLVLDPTDWTAAVTERTAAVMPVHLYGRTVDLETLCAEATKRGLAVVQDAAQAHGATVGGRPVGEWGDAAAFSFYPTKNLGALGDGGAVVTRDEAIADRVRLLRNYGSRRKYENEIVGVNSRLDEMQAALLSALLPGLAESNARRRAIADRYIAGLGPSGLRLPAVPVDAESHVWHVFTVRVRDRDEVQAKLHELGVGTLIFYPVPPHASGAYADARWRAGPGGVSLAERLAKEVLSLPAAPYLTDDEVDLVIDAVHAVCR